MKLLDKLTQSERYEQNWRLLLLQGMVICFMGVALGIASIFNPNAIVLNARDFSWLPVSGMIILSLGILECADAFLAKEMRDFLQNLQVGVLDVVIGSMTIFAITGAPERLSLMIASYLIVRGVVRITLANGLHLPNTVSTSVGGMASIVLGVLIWMQWPSSAAWFLALGLNVEIASRGWAIMMFGLWVKRVSHAAARG
jgi:uncharacterized membrane protein HdeD (DUF308 family)